MSFTGLVLDALFPKHCVACRKYGVFFCHGCLDQVEYLDTQICPACQKPSVDGIAHAVCRRPRGLDGLYSAVAYQGVVRALIKKYKYNPSITRLEGVLGLIIKRMFTFEEDHYPAGTLITAVPLHWSHRRKRGFNQAERLAVILAELYGFKTDFRILQRVDFISGLFRQPQAKLSKKERRRNIKGVFGFCDQGALAKIKGRPVLIVDDIWTTGATLKECGKVLKQAGASLVYAATFARGLAPVKN